MITESTPSYQNWNRLDNAAKTDLLSSAIKKSQSYLLDIQNKSGYWAGELLADASVAAGYVPLMYFMQGHVDPLKQAKVVNYVKSCQNPDGSWSAHYGGPGDLNVSVQVYFSLKLSGVETSEPCLQKAGDFIRSKGGLMCTNTVTRIWLALFGQFDYRATPSIPPQFIFMPNWAYLNIYEFASWSRETIMALILILNTRPVCKVPESADISELYIEPENERSQLARQQGRLFSWRRFFLTSDKLFKACEKLHFRPGFRPAMRRVEKWVVAHQEEDGSWGGIMLPWIYSLMALKSLGYGPDHPVIVKGMAGLDPFLVEDEHYLRMQPATSPVWDTAWATISLLDSGMTADSPPVVNSTRWLLSQEIKHKGDWIVKNPNTAAGCWAFEFRNDFYPDIDDTSVVSRILLMTQNSADYHAAALRGLRWIIDMQCSNGGWAAFDRDNNKSILANVPYADFMTPLDPTSADVTAHVIELLSKIDQNSPALKRALGYLKRTQESDGSWYGRWGVNYIYGTASTLVALKAAGENMSQEYISRATGWLKAHQNEDGGWGETCETYADHQLRGKGESSASQTAWALMGLLAAGLHSSDSFERGLTYLLATQNPEGDWTENCFTGTGFPRCFYLHYDLYSVYFPLIILGRYKNALEAGNV